MNTRKSSIIEFKMRMGNWKMRWAKSWQYSRRRDIPCSECWRCACQQAGAVKVCDDVKLKSNVPRIRKLLCKTFANIYYGVYSLNMTIANTLTVAFFGISGSGKGTQCTLLEEYLKKNDSHSSVIRPEMGNLLRDFMKKETSLAKHTNEIVSAGKLVPSFITVYLLTQMLNESFNGDEHIILDGTCRRPDQSRAADEMMRLWSRNDNQAIVLKLTEGSARERLISRGRA